MIKQIYPHRDQYSDRKQIDKKLMKARHYLQVSSEIIGKHRHSTHWDTTRKLQKAIAEGSGLCLAADLLVENLRVAEKVGKA